MRNRKGKPKNWDYISKRDFIHQLFKGVKFLHDNKVSHRDLKPDNIMAGSKTPIIIDFGLACSSSVRAATPGYAPPEMETNRGRTVTLPF